MDDELRKRVKQAKASALQAAGEAISDICAEHGVSLVAVAQITPDGRIVAEVQLVANNG